MRPSKALNRFGARGAANAAEASVVAASSVLVFILFPPLFKTRRASVTLLAT